MYSILKERSFSVSPPEKTRPAWRNRSERERERRRVRNKGLRWERRKRVGVASYLLLCSMFCLLVSSFPYFYVIRLKRKKQRLWGLN